MSEISQTSQNSGKGFIVVFASAAEEAIPLKGVKITITNSENGEILYNLFTDRSGKTNAVPISVPEKSISLYPNEYSKYGRINIEASLQNYSTMIYTEVPIFDTVTATQQINMLPLKERGTQYIHEPKENISYNTTPYPL